jgi:SET domain-containing protein
MKKLYVDESKIIGKGLFTSTDISKGDFIAYIHGPIHVIRKYTPELSKNTVNWIGVGKFSWINTDKSQFRFINHSCDPNVAQVTKRKMVAIKDISAGEELSFDYSLTESEEGWMIKNCSCKSENCRGKIEAITTLPKSVYRKKEKYIPKNFKSLYLSHNR